jgi:hypothetical protein
MRSPEVSEIVVPAAMVASVPSLPAVPVVAVLPPGVVAGRDGVEAAGRGVAGRGVAGRDVLGRAGVLVDGDAVSFGTSVNDGSANESCPARARSLESVVSEARSSSPLAQAPTNATEHASMRVVGQVYLRM